MKFCGFFGAFNADTDGPIYETIIYSYGSNLLSFDKIPEEIRVLPQITNVTSGDNFALRRYYEHSHPITMQDGDIFLLLLQDNRDSLSSFSITLSS